MILFNEVNSRKLHDERNVFEGLLSNKIFLAIVVTSFFVQMAFVELLGDYVECSSLTASQYLICIAIGFTVFPIRLLATFVPDRFFPTFGGSRKQSSAHKDLGIDVVNAKAGPRLDESDKYFAKSPGTVKWHESMSKAPFGVDQNKQSNELPS